MRVRIDIRIRQWLLSIPQEHWPLSQAWEAIHPAILLAERHRQHPRHDDLDTMESLCLLFWRRLVHHDGVDALLLIVRDEPGEIFGQILGKGRGSERAKGLLKGLLAGRLDKKVQARERFRQHRQCRVILHGFHLPGVVQHLQCVLVFTVKPFLESIRREHWVQDRKSVV